MRAGKPTPHCLTESEDINEPQTLEASSRCPSVALEKVLLETQLS